MSFIHKIESLDRTTLSILVQVTRLIWFSLLAIIVSIMYDSDNTCQPMIPTSITYLRIGPSGTLCFMGIRVHQWYQWYIFQILCFVMEALNSCNIEITMTWFSTHLANETIILNRKSTYFHVLLYNFNWYVEYTLHTFIALSQIDFMITSLIATIIIIYRTTTIFLNSKPDSRNNNNNIQLRECETDSLLVKIYSKV